MAEGKVVAPPPPPPYWVLDLNSPPPGKSKNANLSDPPGYVSKRIGSGSKQSTAAQRRSSNSNEMESLKMKKAWELAINPAKQLPMNAFGMWMTGNSLQIFSIFMVFTLFKTPLQGLMNTNTTFVRLESERNKSQMIGVKIVYVLTNMLALCLGIYKVNAMGLLPYVYLCCKLLTPRTDKERLEPPDQTGLPGKPEESPLNDLYLIQMKHYGKSGARGAINEPSATKQPKGVEINISIIVILVPAQNYRLLDMHTIRGVHNKDDIVSATEQFDTETSISQRALRKENLMVAALEIRAQVIALNGERGPAPIFSNLLTKIPTRDLNFPSMIFAFTSCRTAKAPAKLMPLRPFPVSLRLGTDLCKISRVRDLLARGIEQHSHEAELGNLNRFVKRFMTPRERIYFNRQYVDPGRSAIDENARSRWTQFLAGRWAAKEACIKAVKPRRITFSEIEVWPDQNEGIYAIILDEPFIEKASDFDKNGLELGMDEKFPSPQDINGQIARVSISHDGEYALATVLAVSDRGASDTGGEAAAREPNGE